MHIYVYKYAFIYGCTRKPPYQDGGHNLYPPVHFPPSPKVDKYLQSLKKTRLARSACPSASAVTFRNL